MVETVVSELSTNTPYTQHTTVVSLSNEFNVKVDKHHDIPVPAEKMRMVISDEMRNALIDHLVKENMMISLLVDETTDKSNTPYRIVLLHTLENGYPMI